MKKEFIITLVAPDRSGIVAQVAECIAALGGNWLESRLLHLGGQFAGALKVAIAADQADGLRKALDGMKETGLNLTLTEGKDVSTESPRRKGVMSLSGQDQSGIVKRVFQIFHDFKINVEELETGIRGAPWSGHALFEAEAKLSIPEAVDVNKLLEALETISNDLLVDIDFVG